jgi:type IV secretory pathway protease TraF
VVAEPWLVAGRRDDDSFRGGTIPARRYLLLGEHRALSCDSRFYGSSPRSNIRGKVVEIARGSERIHLR